MRTLSVCQWPCNLRVIVRLIQIVLDGMFALLAVVFVDLKRVKRVAQTMVAVSLSIYQRTRSCRVVPWETQLVNLSVNVNQDSVVDLVHSL
jgi:hypothetical protein